MTAVYDGKTLRNYVGDEMQGEGELHMAPQGSRGPLRLERGLISATTSRVQVFEARFTPRALKAEEFLKMPVVVGGNEQEIEEFEKRA